MRRGEKEIRKMKRRSERKIDMCGKDIRKVKKDLRGEV